jgi:hypothetical protein
MSRSVFEDGRVLRTSDFVADQADHLKRHRLHNNSQHRWGIVAGLDIVNAAGELVVEPGRAVDGYGRDLELTSGRALDLRPFMEREVEEVDVWLVYHQDRLDVAGDGVDRVSDGVQIELRDGQSADARRPPDVPSTDLDAPAPITTDDPRRRWPIFLGRIIRNSAVADGVPTPDLSKRPYAGLIGATVHTPGGELWLDLGAAVTGQLAVQLKEEKEDQNGFLGVVTATPLTVSKDGIVFDRDLTVEGGLVLQAGSVAFGAVEPSAGEPPVPSKDWSITHLGVGTGHELRITMPSDASQPPSRLTIGQVRDGEFVESMAVDDNGTVVIAGNLIVNGNVRAASVQQTEFSEEAQAQLAAVQATPLPALLSSVRANPELLTP